jgi:hypothetical protein
VQNAHDVAINYCKAKNISSTSFNDSSNIELEIDERYIDSD